MAAIKLVCDKCGGFSSVHPAFISSVPMTMSCVHCGEKALKVFRGPKKGASAIQKRSRKQEARVAKKFGGSTTPASGAGGTKGDVRDPGVRRTECKSTKAKSFGLKLSELVKIEGEAEHGEDPIFHVEFAGQLPQRRYVVMPEWVYEKLINADTHD